MKRHSAKKKPGPKTGTKSKTRQMIEARIAEQDKYDLLPHQLLRKWAEDGCLPEPLCNVKQGKERRLEPLTPEARIECIRLCANYYAPKQRQLVELINGGDSPTIINAEYEELVKLPPAELAQEYRAAYAKAEANSGQPKPDPA